MHVYNYNIDTNDATTATSIMYSKQCMAGHLNHTGIALCQIKAGIRLQSNIMAVINLKLS